MPVTLTAGNGRHIYGSEDTYDDDDHPLVISPPQSQPRSAPASAEKAEVISRLRTMQQELNNLRDREKRLRGIDRDGGTVAALDTLAARGGPQNVVKEMASALSGQLSLVMERDEEDHDAGEDEDEDNHVAAGQAISVNHVVDAERVTDARKSAMKKEKTKKHLPHITVVENEGELAWDEGGLSHVSFEQSTPTLPMSVMTW